MSDDQLIEYINQRIAYLLTGREWEPDGA